MVKTTICGTDLHIIKGDTPEVPSNTTLGHEGIGIVESVGSSVNNFKLEIKSLFLVSRRVVKCYYCKKGIYAHCEKMAVDIRSPYRWYTNKYVKYLS